MLLKKSELVGKCCAFDLEFHCRFECPSQYNCLFSVDNVKYDLLISCELLVVDSKFSVWYMWRGFSFGYV